MRAERTHLCNLSNCANAEEECDGEIKDFEVATSAAKAQRCSQVKLVTTYVYNVAAVLSLMNFAFEIWRESNPRGSKPPTHMVCDLNHSTNRVYTIGTEGSHHM